MSTYLKANNTETPCEAAEHYRDSAWGRPTCTVTIKASAAEIAALLPNNAPWSLIEREDALDESGAPTGQTVDHERDMSEYSLSGDITDHRDGTQDDPIPAARGMEYTYGLYYKDPEDTKLYLCERTGEAAGGKIVLQYLPHELVGNYFKAVNA